MCCVLIQSISRHPRFQRKYETKMSAAWLALAKSFSAGGGGGAAGVGGREA